ncbi:MAG TPA: hypothetical protein VFY66_11230 [Anaerolineales bacterium]|nr:hypothetical protein [Anaerolineales bacterium]
METSPLFYHFQPFGLQASEANGTSAANISAAGLLVNYGVLGSLLCFDFTLVIVREGYVPLSSFGLLK